MISLYELLEKKAKPRSVTKNEEYKFFIANRAMLSKCPRFSFLFNSEENDFDIMRANILIHGLINKKELEAEILSLGQYIKEGQKVDHAKFISTIREKTLDLPYLQDDKNKIFLPFFTRALNAIYTKEPEKLLTYPYNEIIDSFKDSMIDPFDTYGYELFNSYFTRLVLVGKDKTEAAYFHYDTSTIYMINSQGRLDVKIVLFDKYIKNPSRSHMLERIKPVMDAYFNCSRGDFIEALHNSGFISNKLLSILRKQSGGNR